MALFVPTLEDGCYGNNYNVLGAGKVSWPGFLGATKNIWRINVREGDPLKDVMREKAALSGG
jgi:hypothetical protein